MHIGDPKTLKLDEARKQAKIKLGAAATGGDPLAEARKERMAGKSTCKSVFDRYLETPEHKKLRSIDQRKSMIERLVIPKWGANSDIDKLLTNIANERGTVMAARVLAMLRHLFNWHVSKTDDFNSPLVRGRKAAADGNGSRDRTLSDEEIRTLWAAGNAMQGPFGAYIKFTLLTTTRRNEAARIARTEIDGTDWTIPGARYKTKREHLIPLSPLTHRILESMPKIDECAFYFTTDGKKPIGGFGKPKEALDALMLAELRKRDPNAELENWTLHDLRRTARSLMSRAGVPTDHAERALGHERLPCATRMIVTPITGKNYRHLKDSRRSSRRSRKSSRKTSGKLGQRIAR